MNKWINERTNEWMNKIQKKKLRMCVGYASISEHFLRKSKESIFCVKTSLSTNCSQHDIHQC